MGMMEVFGRVGIMVMIGVGVEVFDMARIALAKGKARVILVEVFVVFFNATAPHRFIGI